ncbi:hypothetical protein BDF19DRAFT_31343 [Syncephalis fuscata]|nr:hypothetical protein BDF19DRAFT_31343 [Syncephalis fuscata]
MRRGHHYININGREQSCNDSMHTLSRINTETEEPSTAMIRKRSLIRLEQNNGQLSTIDTLHSKVGQGQRVSTYSINQTECSNNDTANMGLPSSSSSNSIHASKEDGYDDSDIIVEEKPTYNTLYRSDSAHVYNSTMDTLCGIDAWSSEDEDEGVPYDHYTTDLDSPTTPTLPSTRPWSLQHRSSIRALSENKHGKNNINILTTVKVKELNIAPPIRPHRTVQFGKIAPLVELVADTNLSGDDTASTSTPNKSDDTSDDTSHIADAPSSYTIPSIEDRSVITPWDVEQIPPGLSMPRPSVSTRPSIALDSISSDASHSSFVWPRPMTWYRRTALEPPYDPLLSGVWLFAAIIISLFEAFTVRLLSSDIRIAFQIGFGGLVAATLTAMFYTMFIDTEDPVVRQARKSGVQRNVNYRLKRGVAVRDNHGQCRVCCVAV